MLPTRSKKGINDDVNPRNCVPAKQPNWETYNSSRWQVKKTVFAVVTISCYKLLPLPSILIHFFPIFQPFYFRKLTLLVVGDCTTLIRPKQSVCIHNIWVGSQLCILITTLLFASAHFFEMTISSFLLFFFWLSLIPRYKFSTLAAITELASHTHAAFEHFYSRSVILLWCHAWNSEHECCAVTPCLSEGIINLPNGGLHLACLSSQSAQSVGTLLAWIILL